MDKFPLTPEGVQQFMQKIDADDAFRQEIIDQVKREGSVAMIRARFEVNGKQIKMLTASEETMNFAIVSALNTHGSIKLTPGEEERSIIDIGVVVGADGSVEVDVSVNCPV